MRIRRPISLMLVAMLSAAQPALAQAAGRPPPQEQSYTELDRALAEWIRIDLQLKAACLVIFKIMATQEERRALDLKIAAVTQIKDPKERETKLIVVQGEAQAELAKMDFAERGAEAKQELNEEQVQQMLAAAAILVDTVPRGWDAVKAIQPALASSIAQVKQQVDAAKGFDKLSAGMDFVRQGAVISAIGIKGAESIRSSVKIASNVSAFVANRPKPSPMALHRTTAIAAFD